MALDLIVRNNVLGWPSPVPLFTVDATNNVVGVFDRQGVAGTVNIGNTNGLACTVNIGNGTGAAGVPTINIGSGTGAVAPAINIGKATGAAAVLIGGGGGQCSMTFGGGGDKVCFFGTTPVVQQANASAAGVATIADAPAKAAVTAIRTALLNLGLCAATA